MIAERPDWCVSRQRFWGVPIIVFYCDACGKQFDDFAALRNVVKWFDEEGADAWFTHSAEELLPPGTKCRCGGREMAQGKRHSGCVVRFRLIASGGAEWPERRIGLRTCISKGRTSIADGSTVRCWSAWACAMERRTGTC